MGRTTAAGAWAASLARATMAAVDPTPPPRGLTEAAAEAPKDGGKFHVT